jgi:hypothetical protein
MVSLTGMRSTPDIVAPAKSSRKIAHEGRPHLGQSSRTPTATAQSVLSPTGMCTTMDVEATTKAFVAVELSVTMSLGPSSHVPEAHAQPMFSPTGMRTTMDVEALAEFSITFAQPVLFPVDSSRNKEFSTTSVTVKLSKTDMGVIAQGNVPRDCSPLRRSIGCRRIHQLKVSIFPFWRRAQFYVYRKVTLRGVGWRKVQQKGLRQATLGMV